MTWQNLSVLKISNTIVISQTGELEYKQNKTNNKKVFTCKYSHMLKDLACNIKFPKCKKELYRFSK